MADAIPSVASNLCNPKRLDQIQGIDRARKDFALGPATWTFPDPFPLGNGIRRFPYFIKRCLAKIPYNVAIELARRDIAVWKDSQVRIESHACRVGKSGRIWITEQSLLDPFEVIGLREPGPPWQLLDIRLDAFE